MSNIVQLVDKLKTVIADVTDIKGQIESLKILKEALYDDVEERLENVKELVKDGQEAFTKEIKGEFISFKEEILTDRLKIREEMEIVLDKLREEIKGMAVDFEFEVSKVIDSVGIKQILEALKLAEPVNFLKRPYVIAYMEDKLKGFDVQGQGWYTIYKVLRSQL